MDISNYLSLKQEDRICREERQYAALLYYVFLFAKNNTKEELNNKQDYKEIIEKCLDLENDIDVMINDIFFETTILRDLHEKYNSFINTNLFNFGGIKKEVIEKYSGLEKYHLGAIASKKIINSISEGEDNIKIRLSILGYMMNAKPDLMVLYKKDNEKQMRARILECKYLSSVGYYKDIYSRKETINQELIQKLIMIFLFGSSGGNISADYENTNKFSEDKEDKNYLYFKAYNEIIKEMFGPRKDVNPLFDNIVNEGVKEISFKDSSFCSASKLIKLVYKNEGKDAQN